MHIAPTFALDCNLYIDVCCVFYKHSTNDAAQVKPYTAYLKAWLGTLVRGFTIFNYAATQAISFKGNHRCKLIIRTPHRQCVSSASKYSSIMYTCCGSNVSFDEQFICQHR